MSGGAAIPHVDALATAVALRLLLEPACERVEIAGSIRRRRPEVHDIEIVAVSAVRSSSSEGLWGEVGTTNWYALDELIEDLIRDGVLAPREVVVRRRDLSEETQHRMGPAYKALVYRGMPVDLFITDKDRWGCIYALRTGPGDWNTRLVTDCKRYWRRVEDGRVLYHNRPIPTPEEADFFRALGVRWIEPHAREADRLRFDPQLLKEVPV